MKKVLIGLSMADTAPGYNLTDGLFYLSFNSRIYGAMLSGIVQALTLPPDPVAQGAPARVYLRAPEAVFNIHRGVYSVSVILPNYCFKMIFLRYCFF